MFEHAVHLPLVFPLFNRVTLVVLFLTFGYGYGYLGQPLVVDEDPGGNDGEPRLARGPFDFRNLLAVEQQLAVAARRVVVVRAVEIFGDIHVLNPYLAVVDVAERVVQPRFAQPDRFDFGPRQYDAGIERIEQLVVERGPFVANIYLW